MTGPGGPEGIKIVGLYADYNVNETELTFQDVINLTAEIERVASNNANGNLALYGMTSAIPSVRQVYGSAQNVAPGSVTRIEDSNASHFQICTDVVHAKLAVNKQAVAEDTCVLTDPKLDKVWTGMPQDEEGDWGTADFLTKYYEMQQEWMITSYCSANNGSVSVPGSATLWFQDWGSPNQPWVQFGTSGLERYTSVLFRKRVLVPLSYASHETSGSYYYGAWQASNPNMSIWRTFRLKVN